MPPSLDPRRISVATVFAALSGGWRAFRRFPASAAGFAAVFALIGVAIFSLLLHFGLAPMMLPLAGGFLLVGPAVLAGFFALRRVAEAGRRPGPADVLAGFRQAPRGLWVLAGVCCLLFLIWVSDAATVYSFMIGAGDVPAGEGGLAARVLRFHLWTSLMGAVLLMAADILARWLLAPQELPVGVLTAALGGTYLLWLMHRRTSQGGAL